MHVTRLLTIILLILPLLLCTPNNISEIVEQCYSYLKSHEVTGDNYGHHYHFYRPSLEKYGPSQWLWDSGFHMITWSHRNVTNSILDLRTMLQFQQPNGRIPEQNNWPPMSWEDKIKQLMLYSKVEYNDLTQMPVLPFSLRAIYQATKDKSLVNEFLPKLVRYFQWWANERSVDGDSLVAILHPWESGLDASPLYDLPLGVKHPKPAFSEMYPQFVELCLEYKYQGWNQTEIMHRMKKPMFFPAFFIVKDIGVNAVYAAGWRTLADLAQQVGNMELYKTCSQMHMQVEEAIIKKSWDPNLKQFLSFYRDANGVEQKITVEAVQTLMPLLLSTIPKDIQQVLVNNLLNPDKFWTNYPIPTVSKSEPSYNPVFTIDLMWRGPTWAATNWLVQEGLLLHGFKTESQALTERWIKMVEKSGIYEMYNPEDASPYGVLGLGMSTLIVDAIHR